MKKIKNLLFVCILLALSSCYNIDKKEVDRINAENKDKPVTIFIHGTIPPHFKWLIFGFDCPHGLTPGILFERKLIHTAIGHTLNSSNSELFPINRFYLYGWRSRLNFIKRYKEAQNLYQELKKFKGPITLIGHSHGGNIILNLARVARELGEETSCPFNIEKVILLAVPVQEDTKHYVKSPIFKKIYALYSTGDKTQVKDPQKLHRYMREKYPDKQLPYSSGRLFEGNENFKQIRMLLYKRNVQHLDFIFPCFLSRLPETILLMNKLNLSDPNIQYLIDIPKSGSPIVMQKTRSTLK